MNNLSGPKVLNEIGEYNIFEFSLNLAFVLYVSV